MTNASASKEWARLKDFTGSGRVTLHQQPPVRRLTVHQQLPPALEVGSNTEASGQFDQVLYEGLVAFEFEPELDEFFSLGWC